ncbi:phosphate acyltransferase PlsX [Acetivibrio mesophilus]|uniref:Phosphate acyltransferase n=1 Tax=Acetivibrio mesophilus TaxID=2487273 RepID=A0A4V1K2C1_9FIRM|nr:phosphate acyltransferase PlsX [Acetivibrio mesophilus]RXE59769.1 phosphate acyltransferase PlsX [Acetivibrio mesophilus]HHV29309.1 phosphate acyltransferase PlsX [Clostridium sp.]
MIILVDAMGGDNAPDAIVNGCLDAISEAQGFEVLLIGDEERIREILNKRSYDESRVKIHHATEVITVEDTPTKAIRSKKDSSMVVGFKLLKEKKGDIFLSCGNSGALMAGALFILGRIKGVDRPAIAAIVPTKSGKGLIIDAGLNTVCKPVNYQQFGVMGSIYMKEMQGIDNPKIGLLNIGAEVGKGNETLKHAYSLLSESNINFVGNVEGNDVPLGKVDVVVCDGFTGNVLLKFYEGAGSYFFKLIKEILYKNLKTKLAALMIKKDMKVIKMIMDADENGGAPILGVDGLVLKSHGSSNAKTIKNVIIKASKFAETKVLDKIRQEFVNMEVEDIEQDL